jgi:hypothetical protein
MDPLAFLNSELAPFIPGLNAFTLPIALSAAVLSKSSGVDEKVGQKSPHGGDVYYAGEDYGYQSPASYKKATGEYPEGYDIELGKKELRGGKPVFYAGKDYGYQSPEGYASVTGNLPPGYVPPTEEQTEEGASTGTSGERGGKLEGEGAKQEQEPVVDSTEKLLEKLTSREFQEDISRTKTRNLIEAATVLSALRAPRERQKQQAEIERQNIQAWRDIRTSQIEANARQQMALGLATVSALTPNMSNFAEIYKASQAPFNSRPSRS